MVLIQCMRLPIETDDCHSFTLGLVHHRQHVCSRVSSLLAVKKFIACGGCGVLAPVRENLFWLCPDACLTL